MLDYNVKIGLVPMRRNTTNRPAKTFLTWVSAEERGHRFVEYIENNFATVIAQDINADNIIDIAVTNQLYSAHIALNFSIVC